MRRALWGALAVLLCLFVAAALPPVQTRLARAVLSRLDGVDVRLDHLAVGLSGVTVEGLRVAAPGLEASVERADVDIAVLVVARAVRARHRAGPDRRRRRSGRAGSGREAAAGCRPARAVRGPRPSRAPTETHPRACARGGRPSRTCNHPRTSRSRGPGSSRSTRSAPGATATLRFEASTETRRDGEAVAASTIAASTTADVASDGRVTRVALDSGLRPLDRDVDVRAAVEVELGADAERYRFDLDGPNARLAHLDASFVPRVSLDGSWELNVTEGVVAAFARGRSTADVTATSTGRLHADLAQRRAEIQASVRGEGRGWEALDPRLADLGALTFGVDVDAGLERESVSVRKAEARIQSAAHGEVLRVAALQPLRFDLQSWLVEPEQPGRARAATRRDGLAAHLAAGLPARRAHRGRPLQRCARGRARRAAHDAARRAAAQGDGCRATAPSRARRCPPFDVTLLPRATLGGGELDADRSRACGSPLAPVSTFEFTGRATTSRSAWPITSFEGSFKAHVPVLNKAIPGLRDVDGATTAAIRLRYARVARRRGPSSAPTPATAGG